MKSVAVRLLCVVGCVARRSRSQAARSSVPPTANDPRVGLKAGLRDAGEAAQNMERIASLPQAGGLLRSGERRPARRRRRSAIRQPAAAAQHPPPRRRRTRRARAGAAAQRDRAARLRELRPRVQRQPRVHGQLPRLQHLRHRAAPKQAEAARVGRLPRRPGRRLGPRQPAVHVGRADARPPRLRHAGRDRRRSAPSASAACASSTSPTSSKPKQVAAVQTCRGSHTHTLVTDPNDTANVYVYGSGTERACGRARSWPAARAAIRTRIRTPRSSAST